MKKRMPSHSSLFLLELIISILFFAFAGTACIQLFVKAHLLDRDNERLNEAVRICVSFSEVYTSYVGNELQLTELYPNASVTEALFLQYYSSDWDECPREYAAYELRVSFRKKTGAAGIMHDAAICVYPVSAATASDHSTVASDPAEATSDPTEAASGSVAAESVPVEAIYQLDINIYHSFREDAL